ncbi:MAG: DinB family protein [Hyphomicrobiales bacterium]
MLPAGSLSESAKLIQDWRILCERRFDLDTKVKDWAHRVDQEWIDSNVSWSSGTAKRELTKPVTDLVIRLFNRQTHHRGPIHALLTRYGARPGDTDLPFMAQVNMLLTFLKGPIDVIEIRPIRRCSIRSKVLLSSRNSCLKRSQSRLCPLRSGYVRD